MCKIYGHDTLCICIWLSSVGCPLAPQNEFSGCGAVRNDASDMNSRTIAYSIAIANYIGRFVCNLNSYCSERAGATLHHRHASAYEGIHYRSNNCLRFPKQRKQ